jgi:hypothetical protein
MAFTLKITGADVPFIYNVAHAVGPGRSNVRDDVMLVQTLLKLAAFPMEIHGTGGTSEGVQVDGIFGDQTKDAIEQFEKFAKKDLHKLLVADGVVSRCGTDAFVPGASVQFKIVHLNRAVRKRPVGWEELPLLPTTHPELRQALLPTFRLVRGSLPLPKPAF